MLEDIECQTVDFVPNFDNTEHEPTVLPARFPNVLVNGSSGIAVGMATNIPPHNLSEVIDGTITLIDNPEATLPEVMEHIKGLTSQQLVLLMVQKVFLMHTKLVEVKFN